MLTFCHCARRQEWAPKVTRVQVRVFINPARLCNLATNSASWLRFSPRKVNLSRSALADVPGARTGRAGAVVPPHLYMIVTAFRQNSTPFLLLRSYAIKTSTHQLQKYRGLSLLLGVVLGSTCRRVHRHGTLSHGDPSAPEHEIAARST